MNNIRTLKKNNYTTKYDETKGKVIISPSLARQILHERVSNDVRIIDIKPDRSDRYGNKSVYVFEDNEDFQKTMDNVLEKRQSRTKDIDKLVDDEVRAQITAAVLAKIKAEQDKGE